MPFWSMTTGAEGLYPSPGTSLNECSTVIVCASEIAQDESMIARVVMTNEERNFAGRVGGMAVLRVAIEHSSAKGANWNGFFVRCRCARRHAPFRTTELWHSGR